MSTKYFFCASSFLLLALSKPALAEDAYYRVAVDALKITDGKRPGAPEHARRFWDTPSSLRLRVVLDGKGEAYVQHRLQRGAFLMVDYLNASVVVRAPAGKDVSGRLFVPKPDWSGSVILKFTIPAASADQDARAQFLAGKAQHYQRLLERNIPGAAWFRHQAREARKDADANPLTARAAPGFRRRGDLVDTYALFTGGRALRGLAKITFTFYLTFPDDCLL